MVSFSEESVRAVSMKSSKLTDKRETHTHTLNVQALIPRGLLDSQYRMVPVAVPELRRLNLEDQKRTPPIKTMLF